MLRLSKSTAPGTAWRHISIRKIAAVMAIPSSGMLARLPKPIAFQTQTLSQLGGQETLQLKTRWIVPVHTTRLLTLPLINAQIATVRVLLVSRSMFRMDVLVLQGVSSRSGLFVSQTPHKSTRIRCMYMVWKCLPNYCRWVRWDCVGLFDCIVCLYRWSISLSLYPT
jgi:hypothetical protein